MVADKHSKTEGLPVTLRESLEQLVDLILSDTVKRQLWANRFTAADRGKFQGTDASVLEAAGWPPRIDDLHGRSADSPDAWSFRA